MTILSFDFNNRINALDKFVSIIYENIHNIFLHPEQVKKRSIINEYCKHNGENKIKFYILCFIHYITLTLFYSSVLFVNNIYFLSIIFIVLIIQILLNIYDGGCFIMKLERKYIGKNWFGPYTLINILLPGFITKNNIPYIFKSISILTILTLFYKMYKRTYITQTN